MTIARLVAAPPLLTCRAAGAGARRWRWRSSPCFASWPGLQACGYKQVYPAIM